MKFKKTLSLVLSALMVMSSAVVAVSAASDSSEEVGAYSNQNYLETQANSAYNEANLGATYTPASTTFKTWSPEATSVKVKLYKTGSDNESGAGVIGEQDVYSKATGVNGKRSMVVDLDSTDPDDWNNDNHVFFNAAQEAVVWEVHVRDFSIAQNAGVSEDNMGKYLAFAEGGTKLNGDANGISACLRL